jgi:pimeloyl-ACP methyl ester carboxylesterase
MRKFLRKRLSFGALFGFIAPCVIAPSAFTAVHAQTLASFSPNGTVSAASVNARTARIFGAQFPKTSRHIELYKIRYTSRDQKNRPVVLSGLVAWPRGGAPRGLVIYNHGTTADRKMSPSRYTGASGSESDMAVLVFASGGYAVAAPDYLGLGDHQGAHPYPLARVNSQSAIDIISPTLRVAAHRNVAIGPKIFVTGYSEGGAVAMWTAQRLDQMSHMSTRFAASAPLSGPYDLSGTTRQSLLGTAPSSAQHALLLYLLSYGIYGLHKNQGHRLTEFFKPVMANAVARAYRTNPTDDDIIKRLAIASTLMGARNNAENVLTPRFARALRTRDTRDPFVRALVQNDVYDWRPRTPMLLVALQNDTVVVAKNTQRAMQAMRARGAGKSVLRDSIIRDNNLNHVTAMPTALWRARQFFDGGFGNVR